MQLWKRRALVLAGAGLGSFGILMSSAGAQVPPFPDTSVPEGFPTFPTFTLPPFPTFPTFTVPSIPPPTMPPTSSPTTSTPPPTMPPTSSPTTSTPPPTMPPITIPPISPPTSIPTPLIDAEELAEEIFNRTQEIIDEVFGGLFDEVFGGLFD